MQQLDQQWLDKLASSVNQPPRLPRDPLIFGEAVIGSVVSDAFNAIIEKHDLVGLDEIRSANGRTWQLTGNATQMLQKVAQVLREASYGRVSEQWREEALAVHDVAGKQIAVVERGAVRALGMASQGVHLVGYTPDQKVWIQQRAWNKANDPGLWDTLMGGMISAADTLETALGRETLEEAGLELEQLTHLHRAKNFTLRMPALDDQGLGYVVERIDWFEAVVPDGVLPLNKDGEVEQFKLVDKNELRSMLHSHAFTLEAALIFSLSDGMGLDG